MKIATVPRKRRRDLIIIVVLLVGIPLLVFASYQVYQFFVMGSVEPLPKNVTISNIKHSSVTISWVTEERTTGSVIPVVNEQERSPVMDERGSGRRFTHYVNLEFLEPNTSYEFIIVSEDERYSDLGGERLTFSTAPLSAESPSPNPLHGSVSGNRGDDVIVYLMLKDKSTYPVSAIMGMGGNWMIDSSLLRDISEDSLVAPAPVTNVVLVAVSGVNEGSVIEGTYSDLFDSNGRLKDVHSFNVLPGTPVFSSFPEAAVLAGSLHEGQEGIAQPPGIPDFQEPVTTFPIEEEEIDRGIGRRLVHDLEWVDMVGSDGMVSGVVGESSVQVVNKTDTSFSVIWLSEEREEGYVIYGTSQDDLSMEANDERDGLGNRNPYYVHMVTLSRLEPNTEYFFEVRSGNSVYDNGGRKYTENTFSSLSSSPSFDSIGGRLQGIPNHKEAIVVASIEDGDNLGSQGESSKIASVTDENGRWILTISNARVQEGNSFFEYTSGDTLNIDVLTTHPVPTHQEGMQGISQRDVDISLQMEGVMAPTGVQKLESYGVLGARTANLVGDYRVLGTTDVEDSESSYSVQTQGETPKTGILDYFPLLSFSILLLVVISSLVYISKMTRSSKKDKMKSNV